jgi:O-antigen/teichoic acid export membrane protein
MIEALATGGREALVRTVKTYTKFLFMFLVPITALGAIIADNVIVVLYGEEMAPAGFIAQLFFLVFLLSFSWGAISQAFYAMEKSWLTSICAVSQATINLGLDFLLIPRYGILGALGAVAIALLAGLPIMFCLSKRWLGTVPIPWFVIGKYFLAMSPLLLLLPLKTYGNSPLGLAFLLSLGLSLIVFGYRIFKVIGEDEMILIGRSRLPFKEAFIKIFYKST